jgi:hypothetical protein
VVILFNQGTARMELPIVDVQPNPHFTWQVNIMVPRAAFRQYKLCRGKVNHHLEAKETRPGHVWLFLNVVDGSPGPQPGTTAIVHREPVRGEPMVNRRGDLITENYTWAGELVSEASETDEEADVRALTTQTAQLALV